MTAPTSSPSTGWGTPITASVGHRWVLVEGGLDLDAVDVLTATDDHVLGPVHDVDEPFLVDPCRRRRCAASHG